MVPVWTTHDRSCVQADSEFLCALALLRCGRSEGYTTARAPSPAASRSTHSDVDGEGVLAVSLYDDGLSERRIRNSTQRICAAILKDKGDGVCQVCTSLVGRSPLAICARDFWRVSDKPVVCAFDDCSELVVHASAFYSDARCQRAKRSEFLSRRATVSCDAGYSFPVRRGVRYDDARR